MEGGKLKKFCVFFGILVIILGVIALIVCAVVFLKPKNLSFTEDEDAER